MGTILKLDLLGESHRGSWKIFSQETNVRAVPEKDRASAISSLLTAGATAYCVIETVRTPALEAREKQAGICL